MREEVVLEGVTLQSTVGTYTVKAPIQQLLSSGCSKSIKDTKVTPWRGKLTVGCK